MLIDEKLMVGGGAGRIGCDSRWVWRELLGGRMERNLEEKRGWGAEFIEVGLGLVPRHPGGDGARLCCSAPLLRGSEFSDLVVVFVGRYLTVFLTV